MKRAVSCHISDKNNAHFLTGVMTASDFLHRGRKMWHWRFNWAQAWKNSPSTRHQSRTNAAGRVATRKKFSVRLLLQKQSNYFLQWLSKVCITFFRIYFSGGKQRCGAGCGKCVDLQHPDLCCVSLWGETTSRCSKSEHASESCIGFLNCCFSKVLKLNTMKWTTTFNVNLLSVSCSSD